MKNRYLELTVKMLLQVCLAMILAVLVGLCGLYLVVESGLFAKLFMFICDQFSVDSSTAVWLYYTIFSDNEVMVIALGYMILIILFVYGVIRRYTNYMKQIEAAIEAVFVEQEAMVELPNELKPMETTLNNIKYMLQQREFATKEAQQQKNDLVVYLAHDLKTPLTSILGYSSLLKEEETLPEDVSRRYVGIIHDKAIRMEMLLEELFDITRFNAQEISLTKREIDVAVMLEQVAEEFYPLLQEKGLELTLRQPEGEKCLVVADGDQLARVFDNLLRNAVSYSQLASEIIIELTDEPQQIAISVSNYGVTIPEVKLQRIFEKFYRADEARSSESGGSGLGLAIAKKIVELHGGQITAYSAELWTTFTIVLPKDNDMELKVIKS